MTICSKLEVFAENLTPLIIIQRQCGPKVIILTLCSTQQLLEIHEVANIKKRRELMTL